MEAKKSQSSILKVALFATGLSGIVAEYVLSTMATYFLGDSVFQFTMIVSVMLFSMGFGSRLSKYFQENLLEKFLLIELCLSLLTSFCAILAYTTKAYSVYEGFVIYFLSIAIGLMIGMEIPLVTRLNESYQTLRENISAVMEYDYYGSLLGGVFFAFFGLPYLGLTYTPFVLGGINFIVALVLFIKLRNLLKPKHKKYLLMGNVVVGLLLLLGAFVARPIILFGEQKHYKDPVVFMEQSPYQKVIITEWKGKHWFYLNGNLQLSSLDEWLYHEPMVHPAMLVADQRKNVLILGGGDGCAAREVLKHHDVEKITLVDLDPLVTKLAKENDFFVQMNQHSLNNPKVITINQDAYTFMEKAEDFYDVILVDFPDPKTVELSRLFSKEFYSLCYKHLRNNGTIVVQSGSPYYATLAFECVKKTIRSAGFQVVPLHNQVIMLGQWGWVVGSKTLSEDQLKKRLQNVDLTGLPLQWLNQDALLHISSFGKPLIAIDTAAIQINTVHEPVLQMYYKSANWDLY